MVTLFILALFLQQQPATIEGIVVKAGTGEPIPRAVVELRGSNQTQATVMGTGADGKFAFRNVPAGRYRLSAGRNGYIETSYGKRGPNGNGSELAVDAGQALKDIRLTMIAFGAISGRVYDSAGDPLPNVTVNALKYSYKNGERTLSTVKTDRSDDRGEYRLFWLPPGQYYISALSQGTPLGEIAMHLSDGGGGRLDSNGNVVDGSRALAERLGEAFVPVYYPGTADTQAAAPVQVGSGADLSGVDFILGRVSMRRIRGIAVDGRGTPSPNRVTITLAPRNGSITNPVRTFTQSDGTFELEGVIPGSYYLIASSYSGVGQNDFHLTGGRTPVDVGQTDVDRVGVTLYPPSDIKGELIVEGRGDAVDKDWHPVVILKDGLRVNPPSLAEHLAMFNGDNRQFTFENLLESEYTMEFDNLPKGMYLKSVRFASTDVLNGSMHVDSRTNERLQIVISANAGVLEGAVVNRRGEPVGDAPVAIVPDAAHRQSSNLYKSTKTDASGRFRIEGIAPGTYSVFAWEDIEEGLWRDPDFIRRNEGSSRPVRILEGTRETIELTAIPFAF